MSSESSHYLKLFQYYKGLADKSIARLSDDQLSYTSSSDDNSIKVIMYHLIGNLKSRWTDVFNSDGEKEWRKRDQEFVEPKLKRVELLKEWDIAWQILFDILEQADESALNQSITIRTQLCTLREGITRQLGHYAYHVGQIVFVAKSLLGNEWESLSIPKGQSAAFNAKQRPTQSHFTDEFKS